jgi:uroporphyrinogen decarboxylase
MGNMFPKEELVATMRCQQGALLPCKIDWPVERICYFGGHPGDSRRPSAPIWRDLWGVGWQKESTEPGMKPFPVEHPLEGRLDRLSTLVPPDPHDPKLYADLVNLRHSDGTLLIGEHPSAIYERAWLLAGIQNLFEAMSDQGNQVDELLQHIVEFELAVAAHYLELKVEAAWIADDYGTSATLRPDMWRRFIRPQLQRLASLYHDAGVLVILHSSGNVSDVIDDLLEIGIDVLDPLQANCNRLDFVRQQTIGRMCLCGGIDSSVLLSGDAARTATQTHERIAMLGAAGGYIVGPDDDWDFPAGTRAAMLGAVEHYRGLARRGRS